MGMVVLDKLAQPVWEIQPGETAKEYSYFITYRDLGLDRSLPNTAQRTGKSLSMMNVVSRCRRWFERAEAWDRHLLTLDTMRAQKKELEARAKRRDERIMAAHAAIGTAMTILTRARIGETDPDQARGLTKEVAKLLQVGINAERLEEGLATEINATVTQTITDILETLRLALEPDEYQRVHAILTAATGAPAGAASDAGGAGIAEDDDGA